MLDWGVYDRWFTGGTRQLPMTALERTVLEDDAADVLGLTAAARHTSWGVCSPPGRYASTVVRLLPGVDHAFAGDASRAGAQEVGLKLFKLTPDGMRAGRTAAHFQKHLRPRLPGLPNGHVQATVAAGSQASCDGIRHFVVQDWARGETLEELHRGRWARNPPVAGETVEILAQLLRDIIVPLWSVGTIWWDVRDANLCWDAERQHLMLIDVDSLAAYASEIVDTPHVWTRRDKGRRTALGRLRNVTLRLATAGRTPASIRRELETAWNSVEPVLMALGHVPVDAAQAIDGFLRQFERVVR